MFGNPNTGSFSDNLLCYIDFHMINDSSNIFLFPSVAGFFIAPVRGVYHFDIHVFRIGDASHGSGAKLIKNGDHICIAYENQPSYNVKLFLEVRDIVYKQSSANSGVHDSEDHHASFSGRLLFIN